MAKNNARKEEWVNMQKFIQHYDLSTATAYRLIRLRNFPCKKVSKRSYRVNLAETDKYFEQAFN